MNKKPTILITGKDGQLGMEFQKIAIDFPLFTFIFYGKDDLDITETEKIKVLFQNHSIDYCINCAAYTKVDQAEKEREIAFKINRDAIAALASVCDKFHVPLIHFSTDYVYHPSHNLVNHEEDPTSPQSVYAQSKLEGEHAIYNALENYMIFRTSWVYSAFGNNFVKSMIRLSENKSEINIVNDQIGSPTYAGDLAKMVLNVLAKIDSGKINFKSGIYNYSNLGFISWADFAFEIFRISDKTVKINRIPSSDYPTSASRPKNSRLSKSKIADSFDIHLVHWKRSLKKCLKEIHNSLGN